MNLRFPLGGLISADVDSFPVDISPYGIRGMGANARDWCADAYYGRDTSPRVNERRVVSPASLGDPTSRAHGQRSRALDLRARSDNRSAVSSGWA